MSAQAQLTLDGEPDPPRIGEWLRCKENKRWAEVLDIARGGHNTSIGLPMYVGDIIMQFGPGYWRITSGGSFFWERWERVDLDEAARLAIETALGCEDDPVVGA